MTVMASYAVVAVPSSSIQVNRNVPLSSTLTVNWKYGLAAIPGSRSQANASLPLNSQVNLLMIFRGTSAPASSLRRPDSIGCEISVLISITSPFLASLGTLRRGLSAIASLASAAADRDLHLLAGGEEAPVAGARHHDHVLGRGQANAGRGFRASRHRREMERGEARYRVGVGDHQHVGDVIGGRHRAVDGHRQ